MLSIFWLLIQLPFLLDFRANSNLDYNPNSSVSAPSSFLIAESVWEILNEFPLSHVSVCLSFLFAPLCFFSLSLLDLPFCLFPSLFYSFSFLYIPFLCPLSMPYFCLVIHLSLFRLCRPSFSSDRPICVSLLFTLLCFSFFEFFFWLFLFVFLLSTAPPLFFMLIPSRFCLLTEFLSVFLLCPLCPFSRFRIFVSSQ